jgi:hypothetical protein
MRQRDILIFTLALAPFVGISHAQEPPKLPFTLSKETTAITSPLNPDGTIDYITAINHRWGDNVKPEENAYTAWLETVGTGPGLLSPHTKTKILQLAGAKDIGTIKGIDYPAFLIKKGFTDRMMGSQLNDEINASRQLWNADDFPLLADYL